jgi:hypothetical protein
MQLSSEVLTGIIAGGAGLAWLIVKLKTRPIESDIAELKEAQKETSKAIHEQKENITDAITKLREDIHEDNDNLFHQISKIALDMERKTALMMPRSECLDAKTACLKNVKELINDKCKI